MFAPDRKNVIIDYILEDIQSEYVKFKAVESFQMMDLITEQM